MGTPRVNGDPRPDARTGGSGRSTRKNAGPRADAQGAEIWKTRFARSDTYTFPEVVRRDVARGSSGCTPSPAGPMISVIALGVILKPRLSVRNQSRVHSGNGADEASPDTICSTIGRRRATPIRSAAPTVDRFDRPDAPSCPSARVVAPGPRSRRRRGRAPRDAEAREGGRHLSEGDCPSRREGAGRQAEGPRCLRQRGARLRRDQARQAGLSREGRRHVRSSSRRQRRRSRSRRRRSPAQRAARPSSGSPICSRPTGSASATWRGTVRRTSVSTFCSGPTELAACLVRTRDRAAGAIFGEARPRTGELPHDPERRPPCRRGAPPAPAAVPAVHRPPAGRRSSRAESAHQGAPGARREPREDARRLRAEGARLRPDEERRPEVSRRRDGRVRQSGGEDRRGPRQVRGGDREVMGPARSDFTELGANSGLGLAALATTCTNAPTDATAVAACLEARAQCATATLVRQAIGRAGAFAERRVSRRARGGRRGDVPGPPEHRRSARRRHAALRLRQHQQVPEVGAPTLCLPRTERSQAGPARPRRSARAAGSSA